MRSSCSVIRIRTKTEIQTQETTNVGKSAFESTVSQKRQVTWPNNWYTEIFGKIARFHHYNLNAVFEWKETSAHLGLNRVMDLCTAMLLGYEEYIVVNFTCVNVDWCLLLKYMKCLYYKNTFKRSQKICSPVLRLINIKKTNQYVKFNISSICNVNIMY